MENLAAENTVELHRIPLRVLLMRSLCLSLLATLGLALGWPNVTRAEKPAADRLRLIVETDAGGDPDDEQSLVRFLLYANEWDVEGIIANRPHVRRPENHNRRDSGFAIVSSFIDAYSDVYPRLREHDEHYPWPNELRKRTVAGYDDTDEAVRLIIEAVDRNDPRPVWFLNWGTDHGSAESNLKRALDRVLAERGKAGYAKFKHKILLCSDDQFGEHTTSIKPLWRLWVYPFYPNMDGGRWYHRFGPLTAKAGGFDLERDVRSGHGPLGALYPTNTGIKQKEGDSLTFLYLIPTGMNDPLHPSWGSWAGRFGRGATGNRRTQTITGPVNEIAGRKRRTATTCSSAGRRICRTTFAPGWTGAFSRGPRQTIRRKSRSTATLRSEYSRSTPQPEKPCV